MRFMTDAFWIYGEDGISERQTSIAECFASGTTLDWDNENREVVRMDYLRDNRLEANIFRRLWCDPIV